jgi:simple sugar transport system permease protein
MDSGSWRVRILAGILALVLGVVVVGYFLEGTVLGDLSAILRQPDTAGAALRLAVPISLAAMGGIFAEKSGVINIGIEGLLIISAFTGILVTEVVSWSGGTLAGVPAIWVGFFAGILASTLLAFLFAVICIEFKADQIIAGLAVWLVALGLAPFVSIIVFGGPNSPSVGRFATWRIPLFADVPYLGEVLFDARPIVYMMLVAVPVTWYVLNRTSFGKWVEASGENPKALDTAGVSVHRVRYASVLLSGVFSGIGGAAYALGHVGNFVGNGATMINGRGFIAIAAYLFGNYNPFGAFGASILFAGLDSIQIRLQQLSGYDVSAELVQAIPYVTVVVVLALVGKTVLPDAAGDHYESGEE